MPSCNKCRRFDRPILFEFKSAINLTCALTSLNTFQKETKSIAYNFGLDLNFKKIPILCTVDIGRCAGLLLTLSRTRE